MSQSTTTVSTQTTDDTLYSTLLLDQNLWDLCCDAYGNIAMAGPPYSLAQDAASQIRTFLGELWYDTSQGVPYLQTILGQYPPLPLVKAALQSAAFTVPGVVTAKVVISSVSSSRVLSGQVQITDTAGNTSVAGFGTPVVDLDNFT
jgi:hypothetical protein